MIRAVGSPTVLLAGGGTGGHLFPGVAVAESLSRRAPGSRTLLATCERDAGSDHGAACRLERVCIDSPPLPRSPLGVPAFAARMAGATARSLFLLRAAGVDAVVGLGGYGSVAPVIAARLTGRPVVLLEQNAVAGRATRLLSRVADAAATTFSTTRGRLRCRVAHTGNPVRQGVLATRAAHDEFGLRPGVPVLAVLGGSLGARGLTRRFVESLPELVAALHAASGGEGFAVLHAVGRDPSLVAIAAAYERSGVPACVRPFFGDMGAVYGTADALLCRAGGTTVAEVSAVGLPAVFVPYPHHADGHQHHNAAALVGHGAASLVPEHDLTPAALAAELVPLLADPLVRARRGRATRRLGRPDAAHLVADLIVELAGGGPRGARGLGRRFSVASSRASPPAASLALRGAGSPVEAET